MTDALLPVYYSPRQGRHHPTGHPEIPQRADILLEAALRVGLTECRPEDAGLSPIAAVHAPGLLAFLQTAYRRFAQLKDGPRPAVPDTFAVREFAGRLPRTVWGHLGYYCNDTVTPILADTWEAAYWSAQTAVAAAGAVDAGASLAYALCRPPGHHVAHDLYGGYCYLNNAAIAAESLARRGRRPAIIDIDYHHGNGTQAIFYDRGDVFFSSIHADPEEEYPYYSGFAHELGRDAGEGLTLNLPMPLDTGEADYLRALGFALDAIAVFAPDVVIVSTGFDTLAGDPHGGMQLETGSFQAIGRLLTTLKLPLLVVQEGGYALPSLGLSLEQLLAGLLR
jgi:acetoin utilization deacetylase AcuC-like enzyme